MQIATERLILRDFVAADWQAVLDYQQKPEYLRYNPWSARSPSEVQEFVQRFLDHQLVNPRQKYQLAAILPGENKLIGNCGVRIEDAANRQASLGYELDPAYWGMGYATEMASAMLAFGFRELGAHRIWASCIAENTASAHVLQKLGMRLEGRLHHTEFMKDRWWDTLMYAILESEAVNRDRGSGVGDQ